MIKYLELLKYLIIIITSGCVISDSSLALTSGAKRVEEGSGV